ncbi:MAG TPA: ABC transporter permease [Vicinamibacterales bacterium]|nr:ABC transporter permease [Vicinamibacterales bacterium]
MWSDLRYAFRSFQKTPALTAILILTLALGIGANTAIFSVIDAVLLRPTPFSNLDRLAMVWETDRNTGTTREPASVPDYLDFKSATRTFDELAAIAAGEINLTPEHGDPVRLPVLNVSVETLPMLGLQPIAGRAFTAEEDRPNGPSVVLISEGLWERAFQRRNTAVGSALRLDDRPYTIVGIMPAGADFGVLQILSAAAYSRGFADRGFKTDIDIWTPLQADPQQLPRSTHPIFVLGRLSSTVSLDAAQNELAAVAANLERAYPENAARGTHVEALDRVIFGPVRPALFLLLTAVALVLIVSCVNVANLLLARASARAQEAAVRCALGASQSRLLRQALAETFLLSTTAAAAGIVLAFVGVRFLVSIAPPDVPRLTLASVNVRVLLITLGIALVIGAVFALLPTIQARRLNLQASLTDRTGRASAGPMRSRVRGALVVAELALAVVLVCGAALLIRSFWTLQQVNPGFVTEGVLKAEYQLPASRYPSNFQVWPDFKEQHAFNRALLARAATLPGVRAVAIAGNHPLDPGFTNSFTIVGREAEARTWPEISIRRVSPGYFATVGLQLVRGRLLLDSDTTGGAPVALINTSAARRFFGDRDPVGAQIRFWGTARTIVGVVADEKFHGLAEASPIGAYTPLSQTPSAGGAGVLLVRTPANPSSLATAVTSAIHAIDPGLAVFAVEPLADTMSRSIGQRRFTMLLLASFAFVALLLAAIGIHGVLSYGVSQRRREIGIRMALGARRPDLVALVVRQGLTLTAVGVVVGFAGAIAFTRLLSSQLFGITAGDPLTFGGVALLLGVVALAATASPAHRAASVDPVVSLRSE